jgi:hypothetical protein
MCGPPQPPFFRGVFRFDADFFAALLAVFFLPFFAAFCPAAFFAVIKPPSQLSDLRVELASATTGTMVRTGVALTLIALRSIATGFDTRCGAPRSRIGKWRPMDSRERRSRRLGGDRHR